MSSEIKNEMTFLEHLEELRWHIIRSVIAVAVFAIIAFIFSKFLFDTVILGPISPDFWTNRIMAELAQTFNMPGLAINSKQLEIISINMSGQFNISFQVAGIAGVLLAFPYLVFEIWKFIEPALGVRERKYSAGAIFAISFLFLTGVLFGYYIITPLSIDFLNSYTLSDKITNQINLNSYIGTVSSVTLASGVIFELPVFVFFLSKIGLVTPSLMRRFRKHALVVILIVAAIITPPDVFSQILVAIPLIILYEVGIVISSVVQRKKAIQDESSSEIIE